MALSILVSATVFFASCDGGDDPKKSEKQVQIDLLVGTWKATSVTHNSTNETASYPSFQIQLAQAGTAESLTYVATGRPTGIPTPWNNSGTITFGTPVTSAFVFGDGSTPTYSVSGSTLTITFSSYSGAGYTARTSSAAGDWVFTFTKQ